jgi:hypothetical protein
LTVVKLLIAKNIASSPIDAITLLSRLIYSDPRTSKGGPLLPGLCSPLLSWLLRCPEDESQHAKAQSLAVSRWFSREG